MDALTGISKTDALQQLSVNAATLSRPGMLQTIALGLRAGAAGTTVLSLVTYADMAARGRPSSSAPEQLAARMAGTIGIPLRKGEQQAEARAQGWGALLGIGSGLVAGVTCSFLVRRCRPRDVVLATVLSAGVMLASDVPLVAAGLTDPRTWGMSGWLSDIVPHAAYGMTTALALR
ncbi:hypothetical protein [Flexivirga alba]|uniref:Uncharacterized protein n=1 Tax=Flexivirga alba TaxID=702742 RepID=A0ABW2AKB5_9MICO